jgi:hypothetical protein
MRTATMLLATILGSVTGVAWATLMASDPAPTQADEAKPEAATTAQAKDEELKLPPGFKKVKRGKFILYCKKETPLGTRFKADRCFDEAGMRDYILALEQTKGDVDRIRSVCSNVCVCGMDC